MPIEVLKPEAVELTLTMIWLIIYLLVLNHRLLRITVDRQGSKTMSLTPDKQEEVREVEANLTSTVTSNIRLKKNLYKKEKEKVHQLISPKVLSLNILQIQLKHKIFTRLLIILIKSN